MQQDFPVGLPVKPPTLSLLLEDKSTPLEVHHLALKCKTALIAIHGPSPAVSVFGFRVDEAAPSSSVGVELSSADGGIDRPVAWIRSFDPGYRPTYRLATPSTGFTDQLWAEASDWEHCQLNWDYVVPRGTKGLPRQGK
jgi:hypothetical protein